MTEHHPLADALWPSLPLLLALGVGCLLMSGCQKPGHEEARATPATVEAVTFCRSTVPLLSVAVAEQQGFFAVQGLAVTVREFVVGREAMDAMLKGECDLATAAEPPVIDYALQRDDFRIVSALQSSDNLSRLVARADSGITRPSDLQGKRIATVKGTAPHYFLKLFLEKHGLGMNQVTIEFLPGEALLPAISSGQVDAIAMTNKVISQARQALGENGVLLESPGLCRNYYMLLATSDVLRARPGVAEKFLRALAQTEALIKQSPDQAQALVSAYHNLPLAEVKELLEMNDQRLTLDHAMLLGLEDTARWFVQQSQEPNRPIPNLMSLIHTESLRRVRPDAIILNK